MLMSEAENSSGLALFDPVRGPLACDMVSVSKDAFDGVRLITIFASNYALTGEKDLALEQLEGAV